MAREHAVSVHERWAHLRFAVVGPLLASPPPAGELQAELARLAGRDWQHPLSGQPVRFAVSTIERWLYKARAGADPVAVLRRRPRRDRGEQHTIGSRLSDALRRQYEAHPRWSYQLHLDNLAVLVAEQPELGPLPSYPSLRRYMVAHGWPRHRPRTSGGSPLAGSQAMTAELTAREVRSYEATHVGGLWHLDFHHGSRKILSPQGEWFRPLLLAILDDHSRLVCHAQWYRDETAGSLVHGLVQAFLKRGLPRAALMDNGGAMIAAETVEGLARLGILHQTTLPRSPYQNGKQENFWSTAEGRLLAMLEGEPLLTLDVLNRATLAWVELDYHRTVHSEIRTTPLARSLRARRWLVPARRWPTSSSLSPQRRRAPSDAATAPSPSTACASRCPRVSATCAARAALQELGSPPGLADRRSAGRRPRTPLPARPRQKRRGRAPTAAGTDLSAAAAAPEPPGIAPLLRKLMADYAATGLPPAYIPQEEPEP